MAEYEDAGLDPEMIYNEGQSDLQAQLEERMQNELNMSPGEVQALFDPAPRRGKGRRKGKRCGTPKQHAKMPQMFPTVCGGRSPVRNFDPVKRSKRRGSRRAAVRRYDPAPSRYVVIKQKARSGARKVKSAGGKLFNKIEGYVPYGVGIGALYSLYNTHLTELKAAGKLNKDGTPVNTLVDAIMYDWNNWSTPGIGNGFSGASKRMQDHWMEIIGGVVGGLVIEKGTKGTKYARVGKMAGRSAIALGAAYAIKAFMDPPVQAGNPVRQPVRTEYIPAPQAQVFQPVPQETGRVRGNVQFYPSNSAQVTQSDSFVNTY